MVVRSNQSVDGNSKNIIGGSMTRREVMRRIGFGGIAACGCFSGCRTTPYTNRQQLILIPEAQELQMGQQAYAEILAVERPSTNVHWQQMILRVGNRISQMANRPNYQWDFQLFASPEQNAFALPGGKVAIYEGLMPICQNEAGVATVMAHEVAHVLSRHGSERISQQTALQGIQSVISYGLQGSSPLSRDLILRAYGVGSQVGVVLPHSRKHELEADAIGMQLMAQAGYDPSEAVRFWQRFALAGQSAEVPALLSTHPSDSVRASELSALLPTALATYNNSPLRVGLGQAV